MSRVMSRKFFTAFCQHEVNHSSASGAFLPSLSPLVGYVSEPPAPEQEQGRFFPLGTAVVCNYKVREGEITVCGITALHNFLRKERRLASDGSGRDGTAVVFRHNRKVILSLQEEDFPSVRVLDYAHVRVKDILMSYGENDTLEDVCVFIGTLEFLGGLTFDESRFRVKQLFKECASHIIEEESYERMFEPEKHIECRLYHYPLGQSGCRKNYGLVTSRGEHLIRAFRGSSGGPIFCTFGEKSYLMGIHTGGQAKRNHPIDVFLEGSDAEIRIPIYEKYYFIPFTKEKIKGIFESPSLLLEDGVVQDSTLEELENQLNGIMHV